jgi:hypothetical protein
MSKVKKLRYREMTKAKAKSKSDGNLFASMVVGRVGETVIEGFSSVIAESIQGLMDEGKI